LTKARAGRAAVVVPLSVAFSSRGQFLALRRAMAAQPGRWRSAFFDRTPDALFGDDVKTRNAVLFYDSTKPAGIETTPILRWTSRTRSRFFKQIDFTTVGKFEPNRPIPKLGSSEEMELYRARRSGDGCLRDAIRRIDAHDAARPDRRPGHAVYVGPTAYNWLSCARSLAWQDRLATSSSALTRIEAADRQVADAIYAVLCSRLVYWLWRVEGDAFHVARGFLTGLPLPRDCGSGQLALLGAELWAKIASAPTVSINKGRRTLGFSSAGESALVDRIDEVLLDALGLAEPAARFDLRVWYEQNVVVDPTDASRASRLARAKEWARA
jgi:hypothetical protein